MSSKSIIGLTSARAFAQDHGEAKPAHGEAAPAHGEAAPAHGQAAPAHGEAATGHAATAGHGGHGPEELNWTDIWDKKRPAVIALFINFGVLMTLYYMLGKKPIANALKQRRVTVGKEIDEAQKLLDEAKERAKKYQGALKDAEADAATAKAGLISSGKGEVERLLTEAQEKAERMKRDAERLVDQERKAVHQTLLDETIELATHEAAQLLQKSVTADDHARLAQDLLLELARRPAARAPTAKPSVGPPPAPPSAPTGAHS